ncbi:MAG: radical SAM family heme chaperone HemW [Dysgonomonas sp.]
MAGIYIHVPYCKTRCIYCDFFTQVSMDNRGSYVEAVSKEIQLRKQYLGDETVETIYFGGGTPSQLNKEEFERIFQSIYDNFSVSETPEITVEANPDDLTPDYIKMLRDLPFNRISIGIQSFDDEMLKFLKRRHSSQQAISAIAELQKCGFDNISVDLMYGLPSQTEALWMHDLQMIADLDIQHISAYHLIYEEGTKLFRLLKNRQVSEVDEDTSLLLFSKLMETSENMGFIHYEISNFAKEGYISRHNSSYWLGAKYLGLGPSAHSFDGNNRAYNVLSIPQYITGIDAGEPNLKIEFLNDQIRYNEYILTGMRTMWGIDLQDVNQKFGKEKFEYCSNIVRQYAEKGLLKIKGSNVSLSKDGIFISDTIMSDLMWV